jgi:hypothetical protein
MHYHTWVSAVSTNTSWHTRARRACLSPDVQCVQVWSALACLHLCGSTAQLSLRAHPATQSWQSSLRERMGQQRGLLNWRRKSSSAPRRTVPLTGRYNELRPPNASCFLQSAWVAMLCLLIDGSRTFPHYCKRCGCACTLPRSEQSPQSMSLHKHFYVQHQNSPKVAKVECI